MDRTVIFIETDLTSVLTFVSNMQIGGGARLGHDSRTGIGKLNFARIVSSTTCISAAAAAAAVAAAAASRSSETRPRGHPQ